MLKVFTGCWGGRYPDAYIDRMQRMVERHLSLPHEFICIRQTDRPGWWGKVEVLENPGPALWLDIDTVITGSLDELVGTKANIRTAKNWAQSGHGGCQSSVMFWHDASRIARLFDDAYVHWPPTNEGGALWGDQEYLTLLRDENHISVDYFDPTHVVSYKYHCRRGLPADARVVCFHGKPDPHEVADPWVKQCWG